MTWRTRPAKEVSLTLRNTLYFLHWGTSTCHRSCWFSTQPSLSLFYAHPLLCGLVLLPNQTSGDCNGLSGLKRGLLVTPCQPSRTCTLPEWGSEQVKLAQIPLTLDTTCLNCYRQITGHKNISAQEQLLPTAHFPPEQLTHFPRHMP